MPYSKAHKEKSREKILMSAVELFSRMGYDNVSIDELMQHAKLTRGAFYAHFKSKSDVYEQAIVTAVKHSGMAKLMPKGISNDDWMQEFLMSYLSSSHVQQERSPCPLAFMATDVANSDSGVRSTYTQVFQSFVNIIGDKISPEGESSSNVNRAFAISAMVIGSVAIARALDDSELRDTLLESSREIAAQISNKA